MTDNRTETGNPEGLCIGQAVVDCIVRGKEEVPGKLAARSESITLSIGGDAVNESIALVQKGHRAAVMIATGEDLAGGILRDALIRYGVDLSRATLMPGDFRTPVANLIVSKDGSRTSVNSPATRLPGYVPDAERLDGVKIVSLASMFRAPLDDPEVLFTLARKVKENGAVLCADTKLPTFRELSLADIRDVLPLIDYIFPNEKEAAYYTGKETYEEMAAVFLEAGVKNVVIKAGPEGCWAENAEGGFMLPALETTVVDSTGAGDHFVAGFIGGLLDGEDFRSCCLAGRAYATESLKYLGGIMP